MPKRGFNTSLTVLGGTNKLFGTPRFVTVLRKTLYQSQSILFIFYLGTVRKYLKFFSFSLREKGGRGLRPHGNTKPEEKLEENIKNELEENINFVELEVFCKVSKW